jgi:hypothetical protein
VITLPDTPLVKEANEVLVAAAPRGIVEHSRRVFLLGCAYADKHRIDFDQEDFYLAALFHDLGLTETYRDRSRAFVLSSGEALERFFAEKKASPERSAVLREAIELHMQLRPRFDKSAIAGLLQVGAWMDVTGLRRFSVWREAKEIAREHPRAGFDLAFPIRLLGSMGSFAACFGLLAPERYRARR